MVGIINSLCVTNIHLKFESVYCKNRKIVRWCSIQSKHTQYFAYNENLEHAITALKVDSFSNILISGT